MKIFTENQKGRSPLLPHFLPCRTPRLILPNHPIPPSSKLPHLPLISLMPLHTRPNHQILRQLLHVLRHEVLLALHPTYLLLHLLGHVVI